MVHRTAPAAARMKRRDVLKSIAAAIAWPLGAQAQASASGHDPRVTPARPDLAAKHLEGRVEAARFLAGETFEIIAAQAPLRAAAADDASLLTEALKGERITIYEHRPDGWAWGQLAGDGYVGFVPVAALGAPGLAPTHRVTALRTFVLPGPSIKRPPIEALSFASHLTIARTENDFAVTRSGGYVPALHLAPIESIANNVVALAERFVGVPYLWGGKTSLGLDCSALVQLTTSACGLACPRDTDMQERALGIALAEPNDPAQWRRGDLVFWKGHVAIVRDAATFVHANAHHMAVSLEPIADALPRIRATAGEITSVRRLPVPS